MQDGIQQAHPFHDITDSDVEDASPENMLLDHNSDEELDHDDVDI